MEKNVNIISKMSKTDLKAQLTLRNIRCAKSWNKSRLLNAVYSADGTQPPKIALIVDIAQLYYKSAAELKEQLHARNLPIMRGVNKKGTIERIIKHDGNQVPAKKPPNPNKPKQEKKLPSRTSSRSRRGQRVQKNKLKPSYSTYIFKLLKQIHPDTGISVKAMIIMNDFVYDILKRIGEEARTLCEMFEKKTMTSREIQTSVRLVLTGELSKHAVSEGVKAVTKFNSGQDSEDSSQRTSQSKLAQLTFPVGRIRTYLKNFKYAERIGKGAPIYLAAVVEYMCAEVLELAGNAARDNKKVRIIPHHIQLACRNDEELNKILARVTIVGGGQLPNIHAVLLPRMIHSNSVVASFPGEFNEGGQEGEEEDIE